MRVRMTIEVTDCDRRYLRTRSGRPGLATRAEVASELADWIRGDLDSREDCEDDGRYHACRHSALGEPEPERGEK